MARIVGDHEVQSTEGMPVFTGALQEEDTYPIFGARRPRIGWALALALSGCAGAPVEAPLVAVTPSEPPAAREVTPVAATIPSPTASPPAAQDEFDDIDSALQFTRCADTKALIAETKGLAGSRRTWTKTTGGAHVRLLSQTTSPAGDIVLLECVRLPRKNVSVDKDVGSLQWLIGLDAAGAVAWSEELGSQECCGDTWWTRPTLTWTPEGSGLPAHVVVSGGYENCGSYDCWTASKAALHVFPEAPPDEKSREACGWSRDLPSFDSAGILVFQDGRYESSTPTPANPASVSFQDARVRAQLSVQPETGAITVTESWSFHAEIPTKGDTASSMESHSLTREVSLLRGSYDPSLHALRRDCTLAPPLGIPP